MRRIFSLVVVALVMAAMMLVMAMPAMAIHTPPNCEHGQAQATVNAFEHRNAEQFFKHLDKARDCARGQSPGEGQ